MIRRLVGTAVAACDRGILRAADALNYLFWRGQVPPPPYDNTAYMRAPVPQHEVYRRLVAELPVAELLKLRKVIDDAIEARAAVARGTDG